MATQKLRKYELIYIIQPEALEEERTKISDRIEAIIEKMGATLVKKEDWGKRKLAYEIRKHSKGYYYYYVIVAGPGVTQEIERVLRMLDNVIRFMTIKLQENIHPDNIDQIIEAETAAAAERVSRSFDDDDDDNEDLDDE
ncbi:30S ribosomal protein S6 [Myxococcota bacterium]|nr:30S ribosomal protein S6 [Myxococcota bacterium]MBU1431381.1 30S ribosomal protein S6 [Myxococcota bacterium]MBU1896967.1 30S ribosomal protein S6 [Myxococcota bacterium]